MAVFVYGIKEGGGGYGTLPFLLSCYFWVGCCWGGGCSPSSGMDYYLFKTCSFGTSFLTSSFSYFFYSLKIHYSPSLGLTSLFFSSNYK
jgi:hypothetical protein